MRPNVTALRLYTYENSIFLGMLSYMSESVSIRMTFLIAQNNTERSAPEVGGLFQALWIFSPCYLLTLLTLLSLIYLSGNLDLWHSFYPGQPLILFVSESVFFFFYQLSE